MSDSTFWFTTIVTTAVLLMPVVAWRFYRMDVHPTLTDRARHIQRSQQKVRPRPEFRPFSGRRSRWVEFCAYEPKRQNKQIAFKLLIFYAIKLSKSNTNYW